MSLHVFFGGSFTPPHLGHHQLLKRILSEPEVTQVHLVPTGINPLKAKSEQFSAFERKQMIDAWVDTVKREDREGAHKLVVETFELESEKASYTVDSLRELKSCHPSSRWVLAGGADLLPQLSQWKSISDLLIAVEAVWLFQRGGYMLSPRDIPAELRSLCFVANVPRIARMGLLIGATRLKGFA